MGLRLARRTVRASRDERPAIRVVDAISGRLRARSSNKFLLEAAGKIAVIG